MKAWRLRAIILALSLGATAAWADGGALLLHQDAGPFSITVYGEPVPLAAGAADLSVIVQQRDGGEVLLDTAVDVTVAQQIVRLTRENAANRLMQAGVVYFPKPGRWQLNVRVRRGQDVAQVSTDCLVAPNRSRATIVWFSVLLPVCVILIFLLHQSLQRKQSFSSHK